MNTLEYLFSDEEKIKVLEKLGYEIKKDTIEISSNEYHDRVVYTNVDVYRVYDEGEPLSFNFQNVMDRKMSQVDEIFFEHFKESLIKLMSEKSSFDKILG